MNKLARFHATVRHMEQQQPLEPGDRVHVKPSPRHEMWWIYAGMSGTIQQVLRAVFVGDETGYRVGLDLPSGPLSVVIPEHCLVSAPTAT